ncbi:MAG: squalene/phytoene synthase family protein [Candidatus Omnitrophica bacterium]|nr:squalene/phytoene synthase family protein [Candidatus Omnitrophota bacterium]
MGLKVLPRPQREAMEVVYAFCRAVDDVVDKQAGNPVVFDAEEAGRELDRWRGELHAGYPTHPIAVALTQVIRDYRIPLSYFEDLIAGCRMDLVQRRYATFQELEVYCRHVASVVGLISIRVFGCRHQASEDYAVNLGIALQLTNILRDLKADLARGRVYLPQDELKRFGYTESDLFSCRYSEPFLRMMSFQCARARAFFRKAHEALQAAGEQRKLLPAQMMGAVYSQILNRIEKLRYDVFSSRITVPRARQTATALVLLVNGGRWNYA